MKNDIVVITGGTRGLGLATAEALAQQDYQVILTGRDQQALQVLQDDFQQRGLGIETLVMDVADDDSVEQAKTTLERRFDHIDCLLNNAGVILESGDDFTSMPSQLVADTININAIGAIRTMQAFHSLLAQSRNPRVVNMSSGMGVMEGMGAGYTAYRMSKAALNVATLQGHYSLHPAWRIRVMAVCPGWVRTDMGGPNATRDLQQGIAGIVWAVNTPADGPSGLFFRDGEAINW